MNGPPTPNEVEYLEHEGSLLDYLLPLVRWRWLIFAGCAAFAAAGIVHALYQPPYYTATAYFAPAGTLGRTHELEEIVGDVGVNWDRLAARDLTKYFSFALKSRSQLQQLLKREFDTKNLGRISLFDYLTARSDGTESDKSQAALASLRKGIEVDSEGAKVLRVSFSCADAALAAAVANAVLEGYETQPRRDQRISSDTAFIKERLDEVSARLEQKEKEIAESRSKSLDANEPDAVRRLAALEREARLLEKLYESLNTEFAKAEIRAIQAQRDTSREIDILDAAEQPPRPSGPNRGKIVLVFLLIGAAVTAGPAFVTEYFRNSRRQSADHEFWTFFKSARRDLVMMAVLTLLAAAAAALYYLI